MQRKAHLLFLPAPRRVRGEFEREHPLIYGVKLTQLAGLGRAHNLVWFEWDKNWAKNMGVLRHPPMWSFGHLVKMARNVDMTGSIFDHKIWFFLVMVKKVTLFLLLCCLTVRKVLLLF